MNVERKGIWGFKNSCICGSLRERQVKIAAAANASGQWMCVQAMGLLEWVGGRGL